MIDKSDGHNKIMHYADWYNAYVEAHGEPFTHQSKTKLLTATKMLVKASEKLGFPELAQDWRDTEQRIRSRTQ